MHWTSASSGVARMWVRIPAWPVAALVSLSKTLNHNCFVLRMGRKAVGPVCCVMHVKEPRTLIVKEKGLAPVFLDSRLEHPAGWICARYKSYHYTLSGVYGHGKNCKKIVRLIVGVCNRQIQRTIVCTMYYASLFLIFF